MSRAIGITGSISTGKSAVSDYLKRQGYQILDADKITHESYSNLTVYKKIIESFDCLDEENNIDRKKLGSIVFNDISKKKLLESIIHPYVVEVMKEGTRKSDDPFIFLDIPLLYEAGLEYLCDAVIVVYCDYNIQIKRLMKRNNISRDEAIKLIRMQMSVDDKKDKADYVLVNNSTLDELYKSIDELLEEIKHEFICE